MELWLELLLTYTTHIFKHVVAENHYSRLYTLEIGAQAKKEYMKLLQNSCGAEQWACENLEYMTLLKDNIDFSISLSFPYTSAIHTSSSRLFQFNL